MDPKLLERMELALRATELAAQGNNPLARPRVARREAETIRLLLGKARRVGAGETIPGLGVDELERLIQKTLKRVGY